MRPGAFSRTRTAACGVAPPPAQRPTQLRIVALLEERPDAQDEQVEEQKSPDKDREDQRHEHGAEHRSGDKAA